MPLSGTVADVIGVLTASLASIFILLSLLCVLYSVYFRSRIHKRGFDHLGYFNGPWITRLALVLVAVWWLCGEVLRLTLLKGEGRLFTGLPWQERVCKLYIVSNVGFAEPALFLILVTLLHASVRKDSGGGTSLSCRWNGRAVGYVVLYCLPMMILQAVLVYAGPLINDEENSHGVKLNNYFTSLFYLSPQGQGVVAEGADGAAGGRVVCTYPLFSTVLLGLFDSVLVCYVAYIGYRVLSLVINKRLQNRIYLLMLLALTLLPLRVVLLGFSILPQPGSLPFEAVVFLAFLALLVFSTTAVCVLVYYPVADALALQGLGRLGSPEEYDAAPFDDYYSGASSLIVNQSHLGGTATESDDVSTMPGSISFRTMIKDDALISSVVEGCEPFFFSPPNFSSAGISPCVSPFQGVPLQPPPSFQRNMLGMLH